MVKAGDVLVRIDPRDYEVAVAKAEADLRDAEAALESSRIDIPITTANTASQLKTATFEPRRCRRVCAGSPAPVGRRARPPGIGPSAGARGGSERQENQRRCRALQTVGRQKRDSPAAVRHGRGAGRQRAGHARFAQGGGPRSRAEHRGGAERRSTKPVSASRRRTPRLNPP